MPPDPTPPGPTPPGAIQTGTSVLARQGRPGTPRRVLQAAPMAEPGAAGTSPVTTDRQTNPVPPRRVTPPPPVPAREHAAPASVFAPVDPRGLARGAIEGGPTLLARQHRPGLPRRTLQAASNDAQGAGGTSPVKTDYPNTPGTVAVWEQEGRLTASEFLADDLLTRAEANTVFAPLHSPGLLGIPTAPTAPPLTNTDQLATTKYVVAAVTASTGGVSSVTVDAGLTGGGTGAVTIGLEIPVAISSGGIGATDPAQGLANLGGISEAAVVAGYLPLSGGSLTGPLLLPPVGGSDAGATAATKNYVLAQAAAISAQVALKAPIDSPTFTGNPQAPQPPATDSSASIATTAFVKSQGYQTANQTVTLSGDVTGSGTTSLTTTLATVNANVGTFQGLTINGKGLVTAATNQSYLTTAAAASTYAPINAPVFTGDARAVTPATADNDTSIATTAYVQAQGYLTTATAGTTYAPIASPTFTGDPKAPTPLTADNDTSIATTAYVKAQGYQTGNQTLTLSGDITGSGATAITATLATVNANVGTWNNVTVNGKGLVTAGSNTAYLTAVPAYTGDVTSAAGGTVNTLATVNANVGTFQGLTVNGKGLVTAASNQNYLTANQTVTLSGDVSGSGATAITATIGAAAVTYAKMQNVTAARLLGNPTGSAAAPSEITLGTNLSFAGTVLNAAGGGGLSGMTAGQIPIAATATTVTSSGNLSGDVTTAGSLATTLATVNANVGTFQGLTLDGKGRVTAAANQSYLTTSTATSTYLPIASGTTTGKLTTAASATGTAGFNLPHGAAPTSPVNGDVWTTTAGLLARINGATVGPFAASGTGLSGMTAGQIPIAASATTITSSGNLSGDITTSGSLATTLATVNSNTGVFQGLTLDGKGRVTAAVNQSYLTTTLAASTYFPLAGGTVTGATTVTNSVGSTGANAGYTFEPRDAAGVVWLIYANNGTNSMRLWKGGDALLLDATGNLQIFGSTATKVGGGSWVAPSDARLKRDVTAYKSGLAEVLALRPIEYHYNGKGNLPDDGRAFVGLDAGDTEAVMPELVGSMMVTWDAVKVGETGAVPDTEIKTIDASALVFALVNCVKTLEARLAALEEAPK